jgi:hypothetical protein
MCSDTLYTDAKGQCNTKAIGYGRWGIWRRGAQKSRDNVKVLKPVGKGF